MQGYLGEFPHHEDRTPENWALLWIGMYGQIDGDHHKAWVLDQVARILNGTPVIATEARWKDGTKEILYCTGEAPESYRLWVHAQRDMVDAEYKYDYSEGIAP